jgi:hypothetical protein
VDCGFDSTCLLAQQQASYTFSSSQAAFLPCIFFAFAVNIEDWEFDGICFPALLRQIPKMLGLFFVVTFGSCLDVAAIQADMPFPIDFNSELGTGAATVTLILC